MSGTDEYQRFGWRAHVQPDFILDGVAINLGLRVPTGLHVLQPHPMEMRLVADGASSEPALRLQADAAHALLDALAAYFGGTGDMRTMRADYLHERGRVDRLIDSLMTREAA